MLRRDGDLLQVLAGERLQRPQPVTESLLAAAAEPTDAGVAARRLLRRTAPQLLALGEALANALDVSVEGTDRSILVRSELRHDARESRRSLAVELGLSEQRIGQRSRRAAWRFRDHAESAGAPLAWAVRHVAEEMGSAAPCAAADDLMSRLGLAAPIDASPPGPRASRRSAVVDEVSAADVLLWLAGPYRPHRRAPGWLLRGRQALTPELVLLTRQLLAADAGISEWALVEDRLERAGLHPRFQERWLNSCGAAVVGGAAVSLWGPLRRGLEAILEANGRAVSLEECASAFAAAGRPWALDRIATTLAATSFRLTRGGGYELAHWPAEVEAGRQGRDSARNGKAPMITDSRDRRFTLFESAGEDDPSHDENVEGAIGSARWMHLPSGDGGSAAAQAALATTPPEDVVWFVVDVDEAVFGGRPGPVPESVVRFLGIGWQQRRTFASRFGPLTIANEAADPTHSPLRPLALAAGAGIGDRLMLGFGADGGLVVGVDKSDGSER